MTIIKRGRIQPLKAETGEVFLFEMNIEQKRAVMANILETIDFIIENNLDIPGAFQRLHSLYTTLYRDYFRFSSQAEYELFSKIITLSEVSKTRTNLLSTIANYLILFRKTKDIEYLDSTFLLNSLFRDLIKPVII